MLAEVARTADLRLCRTFGAAVQHLHDLVSDSEPTSIATCRTRNGPALDILERHWA